MFVEGLCGTNDCIENTCAALYDSTYDVSISSSTYTSTATCPASSQSSGHCSDQCLRPETDADMLSGGAVAGIVIGVLIFVIAFLVIVYCMFAPKRNVSVLYTMLCLNILYTNNTLILYTNTIYTYYTIIGSSGCTTHQYIQGDRPHDGLNGKVYKRILIHLYIIYSK